MASSAVISASGTDQISGRMRKPRTVKKGPPEVTASYAHAIMAWCDDSMGQPPRRHLLPSRQVLAAQIPHLCAKWSTRDLKKDEDHQRQEGEGLG